jgi:hypothetical protein
MCGNNRGAHANDLHCIGESSYSGRRTGNIARNKIWSFNARWLRGDIDLVTLVRREVANSISTRL